MSHLNLLIGNATQNIDTLLNNNFLFGNILSALANKINTSKIVNQEYKQSISNFLNSYSSQNNFSSVTPIDLSKIGEASHENIIIIALIYSLSNLNKYDYHLINTAYVSNLSDSAVISLLLLNNIKDIDAFCMKHNIYGDKLYNIITLKKLSALHKLMYSFQ